MIRLLVSCLTVMGGLAGLACGGDDLGDGGGERDGAAHTSRLFVSLTEAEAVIEEGALAIVRTGGDADVGGVTGGPDLDESSLVAAARYETQSGREFDLFVLPSAAAARRAAPVVIDLADGESGIRAANLIAVFPQPFAEVDAYRAVARALRRLRMACNPRGEGDARLRRICAGEPRSVPPPGEGVDRDEAQDEEEAIVVGGLRYDPQIARRLNPRIAPDRAMLAGRRPPPGKLWFGVFLRVCNDSDEIRRSSARLALIGAFGDRVEASDVLAPINAFAYKSRPIKPGGCLPQAGSVAARVADGALVLFAVRRELLGDPPIALEVRDKRVIVDL